MAKNHPAKKTESHAAPDAMTLLAESAVQTPAKPEVEKKSAIGVRGPKGVALTARITVLAAANPKRALSKAHAVFSKYVTGMTVQEFLDAAGEEATPNIVYDTKHGYISVEGYNVEVLPPKAPRTPKEPKAAKAPKVKAEKVAKVVDEELARETVEEEV